MTNCLRCFAPIPDGEYCPAHVNSPGAARVARRRQERNAKEERLRRWKLREYPALIPHQDGPDKEPKEAS